MSARILALLLISISAGGGALGQVSPQGPRQQVAAINAMPYADAFPDNAGLFQPYGNDVQQIAHAINDCPPAGCAVTIPAKMTGTAGDWTTLTCTAPGGGGVSITDYRGGGILWGQKASSGNACATVSYRLGRILQLTASGSYTPTPGTHALYLECVAGGGAGGGAVATSSGQSSVGGGGGGGAYSATFITAPKPTYTFTIGSGGAGVSGAAGGAGGDTSFDSPAVCLAKGGLGGLASAAANATQPTAGGQGGPGASGTGDLTASGNGGANGLQLGSAAAGGQGGSAVFGGGQPGALAVSGSGPGVNGFSPGAGGSGAAAGSGASPAQAGGNGGAGIIRVWEWQ